MIVNDISRDKGNKSSNSYYRKNNQPFPEDSRSRSYLEDNRVQNNEEPTFQEQIQEEIEDEPEPLQPVIEGMFEPPLTALVLNYN